ncbi:MAG: hypothetical protein HS127_16790 [Planctomycetia bacterium]|nr:hypothetical protein [Planctomycetia bacterium]
MDNRFYRVDPKLRGDKVEVRYDHTAISKGLDLFRKR